MNSSSPSSSRMTTALQEITDIVKWVNTGVKRELGCEKTLMEQRFELLEKQLQDKDGQLEQARLEICVLKQMKSGLEKENGCLKQQLGSVEQENGVLREKWRVMKDAFQALQTKYFQDVPVTAQGYQPVILDSIKEELRSGKGQGSPGPELEEIRWDTSDPLVEEAPLPQHLEVTPVEFSFGEPLEVQLEGQDPAPPEEKLSEVSPMSQKGGDRPVFKKSAIEEAAKEHGHDTSKEGPGAYCLCGLKFNKKRTLDSHVIYFTCEKKFACTLCPRRFVGSNYLKGHMLRSHKVVYTGGSNGCRDCGKTFGSLLQLRRHKKLAHQPSTSTPTTAADTTTSSKIIPPLAPIWISSRRRSSRMRRRYQNGSNPHTALKMLQGHCTNCKFCQEGQQHLVKSGENVQTTPIPPPPPLTCMSTMSTRAASRTRTISRSSSCESLSFSCDFCQKWFGDDKSGLIKHQQECQKH